MDKLALSPGRSSSAETARLKWGVAHVRPVEHGGPDIASSGIAMLRAAHWMLDRGLIGLGDDFEILVSCQGNDPRAASSLINEDKRLILPSRPTGIPGKEFTVWHREHCFKTRYITPDGQVRRIPRHRCIVLHAFVRTEELTILATPAAGHWTGNENCPGTACLASGDRQSGIFRRLPTEEPTGSSRTVKSVPE